MLATALATPANRANNACGTLEIVSNVSTLLAGKVLTRKMAVLSVKPTLYVCVCVCMCVSSRESSTHEKRGFHEGIYTRPVLTRFLLTKGARHDELAEV